MLLDTIEKKHKGYYITINKYHSLKELIIFDNKLNNYKEKFIGFSDNEIFLKAKKLIEKHNKQHVNLFTSLFLDNI
tara:strand:+ start:341 stop:568 length:228 start_codon:yes stop_codon:yes gene_type:complete